MIASVVSFTGPLALKQNSDFTYSAVVLDSSGSPVDLTDYEAKMSIGYYDLVCGMTGCQPDNILTIVHTLNSTGMNPEITFDAVHGVVKLFIPSATMLTLAVLDNGIYDLLLYPPGDNGGTETFLQGPIQILPGVTVP